MEVPVHSRGRGLKINGAARGTTHSKNKQWIAGHGTIGPQSREGSTHAGDGERRERGGGPWRGRGRGRGSSRPPSRLAAPAHHEEAAGGAEEEGHDVADADGVEDEEMDAEMEDQDPDNPEEREKFYQELVKAREVERKRAIAEGKMDDPNVPKRLEDAITMVGTCMDMCPRFERYRRERENNLDRWETIPGTKRVDHKRAVKIYERAAGDKVIPSDLRPPGVLKTTLDYLFHDLIPRGGFAETHDFVRDRSRSVRNDFTIQHDTGPLAIECHARCARFHILALHLLRDKANLSTQMEQQQLMFTLQSLKEFFQDQRGRYSSPSELEMRVYHRLIHIRDQVERHDDITEETASHPVFTLTTKFRQCVQKKSAPITKTSTLKVDAQCMQIFAELASVLRQQNDVVMVYLVACIIETVFGYGTVEGIEQLRGDLTIPDIIDGISKPLSMEEKLSKELPPSTFVNTQPTMPSVGSPFAMQVTSPPSVSANAAPLQREHTHSAFSNLTTKPNPFSSSVSVFGGASASTSGSSTPQSVFATLHQPILAPPSSAPPPSVTSSINTAPFAQTPVEAKPPLSISTAIVGQPFQPAASLSKSPFTGINGATKSLLPGSLTLPSTSLNLNAPTFVPSSTLRRMPIPPPSAGTPSTPPPLALPTTNIFNTNIFSSNSPMTTSPTQDRSEPEPPKHIVERSETLWDFPGLPSGDFGTPAKGLVTPATGSPIIPPPLGKAQPMPLPPTPTARWFDPTSYPKKTGSSLSLRKQSLLSLQMPDQPSPAEILSPLALPSPRVLRSPPAQEESPTPKTRLAAEPVASSSRLIVQELAPVAKSPKGKEKELPMDPEILVTKFLRHSPIVKKAFRAWQKKTTDRAAYEEACRRSDAYKEKIQREKLSSSLSSFSSREQESPKQKRRESFAGVVESVHKKRARQQVSGEYRPSLTDEQLARRLKENHEEHERRWVRGSFLKTIRTRVVMDAPDNIYPSQWRVWLSMNMENDGTAIWLEHKFDMPDSGEWVSENVFSIPIVPKNRKPPSPGSPGLIVFERTPLEGFEDVIEKKYRILDDCSRLRDIIESYRALPKLRFTPSLLVITWADGNGSDTTPDFDDMVKQLIHEDAITAVGNLVISSTATNLDDKFEDVTARLPLDFEDKATLTISWKCLAESFITPFRNFASDWLDSCWVNERETLDWSRYGEVVRSVEEVQTAFVRELLGLINVPYKSHAGVEMSVDLHDHAHLGEAYATGLFLDAVCDTSIRRAEEALGRKPSAAYALPRDRVEAARGRFDGVLQSVAERLRVLAAASLSSRSAQKRRASEDDNDSGSPSSPKRLKASPTTTSLSLNGLEEAQSDVYDVPPLSTTPSIATFSEAPQVTVAMLRALAQGILKSK